MEHAIVAIRTAAVVFVAVAVLFGTYLHRAAKVTATSAAAAAATAAARSLDHTGWDCTGAGAAWDAARTAAAEAAVRRTQSATAAAADFSLAADAGCTVVASVSVAAAGAHRWLHARSAACAPTRSSTERGWTLPPPC